MATYRTTITVRAESDELAQIALRDAADAATARLQRGLLPGVNSSASASWGIQTTVPEEISEAASA